MKAFQDRYPRTKRQVFIRRTWRQRAHDVVHSSDFQPAYQVVGIEEDLIYAGTWCQGELLF